MEHDLYNGFIEAIHKHIPGHYFKNDSLKEANASIMDDHQFIHFLKNVPFVVGIFNTFKTSYEFLSPNYKEVLGNGEDLFIGENGMKTILSNFKPEHGQIYNTHIFPTLLEYYTKRIPYQDIKDFRFTASFGLVQKDNSTKWFVQQINAIDTDESGFPLLNLVCMFDISGVKKDDLVDLIIAQKKSGDSYSNVYAASYSSEEVSVIFTERELEIIALLSQGKSSRDIAEQLSISIHTVSNHRRNMLLKAKLKNTIGLIQMATERKYI